MSENVSSTWRETKLSNHQKNISVEYIAPYTPLLYRKTGVYWGIPNFLIFDPKIHCVYPLEPPRRGGSNMYTQCMF